MPWLKPVTYESASEEAKSVLDEIGREKPVSQKLGTLLINPAVYKNLEVPCCRMDDELQARVGNRLGDLLEYAVSLELGAPFCLYAYSKCMEKHGIEFGKTELTEEERLIVDFGRAVARDPKGVSPELKARLKEKFSDGQLAVITGMAVLTVADNIFEIVLELKKE